MTNPKVLETMARVLSGDPRLDILVGGPLWGWRGIESAPLDGTHILACDSSQSFGWMNGATLPPVQTVVHWWANPGEEGWYTSVSEIDPQRPFAATHWKPLDGPAETDASSPTEGRAGNLAGDESKSSPTFLEQGDQESFISSRDHDPSTCAATPKSAAPEAEFLKTFMSLGRPQGNFSAFVDMHPDDILFSNSGVHLTVGDIRDLQAYFVGQGVQRTDRLTQLMQNLPEGTRQ